MDPTNMDAGAMEALEEGMVAASLGDEADEATKKRKLAETKQVSQWLETIKAARSFDEGFRKQIARDRRYAAGESGFEVDVNLIGTNIDITTSFIYAQNPQVDVVPAQRVQAPKEQPPVAPQPPPGLEQFIANPAALLADVGPDQLLTQGVEGTAQQLGYDLARKAAEYRQQVGEYEAAAKAYQARAEARRKRRTELQLFAQTLEIVIGKLWKKGKLKRQARRAVRSALTNSIGWLKLSWQERSQRDPLIQQQINDLQDNLRKVARLKEQLDNDKCAEADLLALQLEQQMRTLTGKVERIVARGMAIDVVTSENLQVAPGVEILQITDAEWAAERVFMTISDTAAKYPDVPLEKLRTATRYCQRKDAGPDAVLAPERAVEGEEADRFVVGDSPTHKASDSDFLCLWEVWSLDSGNVFTLAEGMDCYLTDPQPPNVALTRFYPYYPLAFIEVDGKRAPQSLTFRSWKLNNEYNRTRSQFAEHRRRSKPAVLFDETEIDPDNAKKLTQSQTQEYVGLKSTTPGADFNKLFAPKPQAAIDGALYTTEPIRRDMDDIWGVQQALQGSIKQAQTATEAKIQQGGFMARSNQMRDQLEDWLTDIANGSAQIAVQVLEPEDVLELAGEDAVWPPINSVEDLENLVDVDIRAGSSGKPSTEADREAWAAVLPVLERMVPMIGKMRGAAESEVADKLEAIAEETLQRAGGHADVLRFIPQNEGALPQPGQPGAADPSQPQEPAPSQGMAA
jgi:hypothetical protein